MSPYSNKKFMDPYSETTLDDLLTRSQNLERRTPFLVHQSLELISTETRATMSSIEDTEQAKTRGKLLLAQEKADISRTHEILKGINHKNIVPRTVTSINDKTEQTMQNNIVSSITEIQTKTSEICEEFIFKNITNRWNSDTKSHHFAYSQIRDEKTGFYIPYRIHRNSDYSRFINKSFLPEEFASKIVKSAYTHYNLLEPDYLNIPLIDTFELISFLQESHSQLEQGVIKFLETQKKRVITQEVNRFLPVANRGGEFDFLPTVVSYINMHHSHLGESGLPWAIIYYLLRCGDISRAAEYSTDNSREFSIYVVNFLRSMNNGISFEDNDRVENYLSSELSNIDANPFKIVSLSVMLHRNPGHRDIIREFKNNDSESNSSEVIRSLEDWVWLRLHMKDSSINDLKSELEDNETESTVIQNPFLSGQKLIMSGEFEKACQWFLSQEDNIDENIHIALALHLSGFVPSKSISQSLITYATEVEDLSKAVGYLSFLQDFDDKVKSLSIFIVEDERGLEILSQGTESHDNSIISEWLTPPEIYSVLNLAGEEAEMRDEHCKAYKIFKMISRWDKVISNANIELRQCVEGFVDDISLDETNLLFLEIIQKDDKTDLTDFESFKTMYYLAISSIELRHCHYSEACSAIDKSGLFPSTLEQVDSFNESIRNRPEIVRRVFPTALENAMHAYSENFRSKSITGSSSDSDNMKILKKKSSALFELATVSNLNISRETMRRILDYTIIFQ
ncbi:hypothetical protein TVAG_286750 [Trichomonas vaginalis G3]|uniref:Nuclear pore protein n=1 Tax=Trichomonas vaginalis (strain ATCC PRA-98 / G3) TaxID=412133 RepID=A2F3F8_TRIV3|nr:nuclear pore complex assembly [Trichomonas vaginalis G3]EAY00538.1 hypothetical protein TVAG_286750 [Trichomonas vaginalis G3]KAI5553610.1 nuclear pore complex assembly [Trichomonas vaginalis G3]|eukprot:XP_001313467.1 hypothetical protein [Trichomonas vaginalis G3]